MDACKAAPEGAWLLLFFFRDGDDDNDDDDRKRRQQLCAVFLFSALVLSLSSDASKRRRERVCVCNAFVCFEKKAPRSFFLRCFLTKKSKTTLVDGARTTRRKSD